MQKAVFLDRDGVINRERGDYTWLKNDFEFLPDLFANLIKYQDLGYVLIVITNQGGISKGVYSLDEFRELNRWMISELKARGINILKSYFSPDHDVNTRSLSRKPESMLFERAISQFDIDISKSFMIGDSERDVIAAEKAGVKGVLIEANSSLNYINIID